MHRISPRCDSAIVVCVLSPILLTAVASAQALVRMAMIRQIHILATESGIEVQIDSSRPVTPQTQILTGPDRIVIDFPEAVPASHLRNLTVNQGGIKAVSIGLYESNPPIARVVLTFVAFLRQRDYTYVVITLVVLGVLLFSLLSGR